MNLLHGLRLAPPFPSPYAVTVAGARAPVAVVTVVGGGGKTSIIFRLAHEVVAAGGRVVIATTTRVAVRQLDRAPALLRLRNGRVHAGDLEALARALDAHQACFVVGSEILLHGKQAGVEPEVVEILAAQAGRLGIDAIVVEGDGSRTLPVKAPAEHEPVIPPSTTLVLATLGLDAIGAPIDEEHTHRSERIRLLLGLPKQGSERLTPAQAATLLVHPEGGAKLVPPGARLLPVLNKADVATHRAPGRLVAARLATLGFPSLLAAAGNDKQEPVLERWGPVAAVVLAAGASQRFGTPKQVAKVDGLTLVERALNQALESGAQQVVVVTGAAADQVQQALSSALERRDGSAQRVSVLYNEEWASGQSSSLRLAVRHLASVSEPPEALLCLPVDQPWLEASLLRRLILEWRIGADLAAPSVNGDVRGAPALFDRSLFGELLAVQADKGGRELLQRHSTRVRTVPTTARSLTDVDAPGDLTAP